LFLSTSLLTSCAAHVNNTQPLGDFVGMALGAMVDGAVRNPPVGSQPAEAEGDVAIEQLMAQSRRLVRRTDAACRTSTELTGPRSWTVDSCEEHLSCQASGGAHYTCIARQP